MLALPAVAAVLGAPLLSGPAGAGSELADGKALYERGCVSCHGHDGEGVTTDDGEIRGPALARSGEAAAYYYLSTGRMPLANSEDQPSRKTPAYDEDEIAALVVYVASLGEGPTLPDVNASDGELAPGGEVYRTSCQACHSASGAGGALSYGRAAPRLDKAEPLQIAAAVRAGPGQMPVFDEEAVDVAELRDLIRYVRYLRDPADPGGLPIGRTGPIPEGFVAWIIGIGALLGLTVWIGTRSPIRGGHP